jgi:phosphoribosylformimino-5-aminoimidazole carboxamide ribotide isomerase
MGGANQALYRDLTDRFSMNIIASGGVSSLEDIRVLKTMGLHGAIVGKAYYIGAISLPEAIEVAK